MPDVVQSKPCLALRSSGRLKTLRIPPDSGGSKIIRGNLDFSSKFVETPCSNSAAKPLAFTSPEAENHNCGRAEAPFSQTRGMES